MRPVERIGNTTRDLIGLLDCRGFLISTDGSRHGHPDPETIASGKTTEEYRNYDSPARDSVREFYRLNHTYQTYDFVQEKRAEFLKFDKKAEDL